MNLETVISILSVVLASNWIGNVVLFAIQGKGKLKKGVCALLRNEIVTSHRRYTSMGYCPYMDRRNINDMYEAYHGLGGNGIVTDLMKDILALPLERENEKQ